MKGMASKSELSDLRRRFRDTVLARHGGACCVPGCGERAVDAHHLLERRLWRDGGYVPDNGAAVCAAHHLEAKATRLSVEDLRGASGIVRVVVPDGFDPTVRYDKWGNEILRDGRRLRGPLAGDVSVRKVLDPGVVFACQVKYPRTPHLPLSPGRGVDDVETDAGVFAGVEVVVTEKMDGENTTFYPDGSCHARSIDSLSRPWQTWVRAFAARTGPLLPAGWRVCGENLYARHSLAYAALPSFFAGFAVFDDRNVCLSWDETVEWFSLLEVVPARVLYRGVFDRAAIEGAWAGATGGVSLSEGFVVRVAAEFPYARFAASVAKWVRAGHVQTDAHWTATEIVANRLV